MVPESAPPGKNDSELERWPAGSTHSRVYLGPKLQMPHARSNRTQKFRSRSEIMARRYEQKRSPNQTPLCIDGPTANSPAAVCHSRATYTLTHPQKTTERDSGALKTVDSPPRELCGEDRCVFGYSCGWASSGVSGARRLRQVASHAHSEFRIGAIEVAARHPALRHRREIVPTHVPKGPGT